MLPTIAQPLASLASGGVQALVGGLPVASAPVLAPGHAPGSVAAAVVDAFAEIAKVLPAASGTPAASRARSTGAGYAAAASGAAKASSTKKATATKKAATTKKTSAAKAKSSAPAKRTGPLAFLDDKKLSVEEKLMRLLAHLSAKWDKDLDKKIKELGDLQKSGGASSSSASARAPTKKSGGILGSLGSVVQAATKFFPGVGIAVEALKTPAVRSLVSSIGGPVLGAAATAMGFPSLAPALVKYAPAVVKAAAGIAASLDDPGAPAAPAASASGKSGGASSSSSSKPSETGVNDSQMRAKLLEIQRIQDVQKEMFSLVSNILRSSHDTRMNVIQNVR